MFNGNCSNLPPGLAEEDVRSYSPSSSSSEIFFAQSVVLQAIHVGVYTYICPNRTFLFK
jgi:hypothetical protein